MANSLATTGSGHNALQITQQYPAERFNLLVPMQTVAEIADIHKPVMNVVQISTNPADKEIYEQEKATREWTGRDGQHHPAKPAGWALTKKGLNKLMRAAGIKILNTRPVVPSTCQKCAEVNRGIGPPGELRGLPEQRREVRGPHFRPAAHGREHRNRGAQGNHRAGRDGGHDGQPAQGIFEVPLGDVRDQGHQPGLASGPCTSRGRTPSRSCASRLWWPTSSRTSTTNW